MLQSIKYSNRKISKMEVDFGNLSEMEIRSTMSIIENFSSTIKYFKIRGGTLTMSDFDEIMALLPNVEHLVVGGFALYDPIANHQQDNHHLIMASNEYPHLHQLKTLELLGMCYDDAFFHVLYRLRPGLLRELRLADIDYKHELAVLIDRQRNIKKLTISCWYARGPIVTIATDIFDNMKLDSLELNYDFNMSIEPMWSKQTTLKSLKLDIFDTDHFNVVVNQLTELETLSLDFNRKYVADFENIGNLKKLKDLTVRRLHSENLAKFPTLKNSQITNLNIESSGGLFNDGEFFKITTSVRNLKVLHLKISYIFSVNIVFDTSAIMKHFNFVEVLRISDTHCIFAKNLFPVMHGDCFNEKLIELNIDTEIYYSTRFLNELIASYPSLKKLVIRSKTPITAQDLQLMLNGFQDIESMTLLRGASILRTNDLQYLRDTKKNLKFISFGDLREDVQYNVERSGLFDVTNIAGSSLNMAVNQRTMKRELKYFDYKFNNFA